MPTARWLRHEPLPLELARETIAALADEGYSPNVYVDDELYVAERHRGAQRLRAPEPHRVPRRRRPARLARRAADEARRRRRPERARRARAAPEGALRRARVTSRSRCRTSSSSRRPGVTKGAGLDFLAEQLGFTKEQTIAFGDGENDVELVEWAGFGIAVENAHERVKAVADWICPPAADEGVAQVLEALLDSRA